MSFLINWDLLAEGVEAEGLRGFLNSRFQEIERPPFLGPCEVTELDFGDIPPDIIIQDICDPSPEFYLPDDIDSWQHSIPPFSDDASASTPRSDLSWDGGYGYTGALGVGGGGAGSGLMYTPVAENISSGQQHYFAGQEMRHRQRKAASSSSSYDEDGMRPQPLRGSSFMGSSVAQTPPSAAGRAFSPSPMAFGTGWSGSVGLGLGLGVGSAVRAPTYSSPRASPLQGSSVTSPFRPPLYSAPSSYQTSRYIPSPPIISPRPEHPGYLLPSDSPRVPATPLSDHELALQYAESMRRESDAQVEVEIAYKGSMRLAISTELIVNQPTPAFMVLPLTLTLTGFHFTATAIVAYLGDRVNFCFKEADTGAALLRDVSIDSEVGDRHKQVLKNVGKIERFIVDQLRKVIQDFLVFPNHQTINLLREPSESDGSEMYKGSEPYDDDSFDGI